MGLVANGDFIAVRSKNSLLLLKRRLMMTTKEISEKTGIPWTTLISWAKSDPAGWRYQLVMAMSVANPDFFSKFNPRVEPKSESMGLNGFGVVGLP